MKENPVIYLTGAPATGKSSAVKALTQRRPSLLRWDWGAEASRHLSRRLQREVSYEEVRRDSGSLITPTDVAAIDRRELEWVAEMRVKAPVLIDTHAVTRESFGFRTTPFSDVDWKALRPTHLILLYASPETIIQRLANAPAGRRPSDTFHSVLHAALQGAVLTTYAILLGAPMLSICTDVATPDDVAREIAEAAGI